MQPLFSIITVTYNAAATVVRTIESVDSQTFSDYEQIIVDGASTDNTLSLIAESERRQIQSEPDKGLYDAMNKGIKLARGQYLIFLNAGDKFHDARTLSRIARAIQTEDSLPDIVYGQTAIVDNEGNFIGERHLRAPRDLKFKDFARGMLVCHQAFIVRRDIAPTYDLSYRYSADYEWCLRCLQKSRSNVFIDDYIVDYLNEGVTTANHKKSLHERYDIMCKYYGTFPTALRHLWFAIRALKRKLLR